MITMPDSASASASLFCLPPTLRHHIYLAAGVPQSDNCQLPVNLNRAPSSLTRCHGLLLTCRAVYHELARMLYSGNFFLVRYTDSRSLDVLGNLRPTSIAFLTQITIHLNVTACADSWLCCEVADSSSCRHREEHNSPLDSSAEAVISAWQTAASYLAAHIKPSSLQLHLICDADGIETATRVLEPLRRFPRLAECDIRLARQPDRDLQNMAQHVATQAMAYPDFGLVFQYFSLPQEIRIQILEYTDLVTPLCEVEWNPERNFYLHYTRKSCPDSLNDYYQGSSRYCHPDLHQSCKFRNCWQYETLSVGCFCRRHHAAFSQRCRCWSPPTSLFLASKRFRQEALSVFFSKNRFIILPSGPDTHIMCEPVASTPTRLEISTFLMNVVPPEALTYLRNVNVIFPPFHGEYLLKSEPGYQDWCQTIDFVSGLLDLPMLTLCVEMEDYLVGPWRDEPAPDFRDKMSKEKGLKTIIYAYFRILAPLLHSKLRQKGLCRFSASAAWPWAHTRAGLRRTRAQIDKDDAEMAKRLTQFVMGKDYDSSSVVWPTRPGMQRWAHIDPYSA